MPILEFPPVEEADEHGLLAVGGDLHVSSLLLAYSNGIFPWPHEGYPMLWFAPAERAVLDFEDFHIPTRLARYLKKTDFTFHINTDFPGVIRGCRASVRKRQQGTWITPEIEEAYTALHYAGYAHSFEARNANGELVGGMYGVMIGRAFAGESMFYRESHASKFVIVQTVAYFQQRGMTWFDIEVMTPHMALFGAKEIPRSVFMRRLKQAIAEPAIPLPPPARDRWHRPAALVSP
ncbi:MAG: leucyl/phenylalanyl-tRNA--protein transferase [Chloracidobacterium sp.]|uniref:Leucyl/phenylalanyl-tRNA--protein transferase n=1 Tax=Chloracidobacterium validum TaxID=2821543 RepID=A0ABX8BBF4_9BACT|nr:leucyl/phenylalanyl-tRNA--protein transferase [Chloracidobacterium validum]QUW04173.1 leucyl/phenylalanyl-tRNA--protein transferase [Chloracidobacterium validum]